MLLSPQLMILGQVRKVVGLHPVFVQMQYFVHIFTSETQKYQNSRPFDQKVDCPTQSHTKPDFVLLQYF